MTSFIGRRHEMAEAKALMSTSRLVTLTGAGGVGKTRMAGEITQQARRAYRDGVRIVELAPLTKTASVAAVVAAALEVSDQSQRPALDRLADFLQDKELLLVLDNCEHLLDEVSVLVHRILGQAPDVRILATSREPVGITGETLYAIPPMSTPPIDDPVRVEQLESFEAVALFVARARNVVPGFALDVDNAPVVAQLCTQLDGMPLAIELATTRLRSLSATQLLDRLDRRFQLLNRGDRSALPRQQTLRALIDWSYELCSDSEQMLWRRLSVFPGSFDMEAAEAVCGFGELPSDDIVDLLDSLVAKSILSVRRDGEVLRYHQLVTIREYGQELLANPDEVKTLRTRHLHHYVERCDTMVRNWCSPHQSRFLQAARGDRANLTSAMDWALEAPGEHATAARLASLLRYQWVSGNFITEGRALLDRVLSKPSEADPLSYASAMWVAAWVSLIQGDHDTGADYARRCLTSAQKLEDPALEAHAEHWLALHRMFSGDLVGAIELYRKVSKAHDAHGDTAAKLTALFQLGMAQALDNRLEAALETCRQVIEIATSHGELWNRAYAYWIRGISYWQLGEYASAVTAVTEALRIQQYTFQDGVCVALSLETLHWITVSMGDYDRAAELAHAVASVWSELGITVAAFGPHMHKASLTSNRRMREALGRRYVSKTKDEHRMSKTQAIDCALGVTTSPAKHSSGNNPLTKKEMQVAGLVAQGLTNRLIAQQLVISPRTVDGHVERILAKLSFRTRSQIASWATAMGRSD
ncbi:LuxR C-terminal-related transcriptional regulator [Paeniglutamicibacter sp. ABSL32-1]|uniref:LuxR C-terminal-related transcriptional regulator n=1 Tax=Paeniglutamicibacter quisquiliarum TaxID=2849498 RepID=UPI001C2DC9FC|nr:LuxR C-terminal-related transcriptional regulator [Paeniglutamicibacter quisquiliarum]MBV1778008.1 LuxR C-terminal-related transcriptional regulator [Paeniglutamicibacter quisquiliarum]